MQNCKGLLELVLLLLLLDESRLGTFELEKSWNQLSRNRSDLRAAPALQIHCCTHCNCNVDLAAAAPSQKAALVALSEPVATILCAARPSLQLLQ